MASIKYIGTKPVKHDNVAGTSTIWTGPGDVKEVSDAAVPLLLKHPTVWELAVAPGGAAVADEDEAPRTLVYERVTEGEGSVFRIRDPESSEVLDLGLMTEAEIKSFARVNGIKADLRKRNDELRAVVMAAAITPEEV